MLYYCIVLLLYLKRKVYAIITPVAGVVYRLLSQFSKLVSGVRLSAPAPHPESHARMKASFTILQTIALVAQLDRAGDF
jgi:hypothetical protein